MSMDGLQETRRDELLLGSAVTLKEHLEARIDALELCFTRELAAAREVLGTRMQAHADAVAPALDSLNHRLDEMNRFREALSDQAASFVSRELHDAMEKAYIAADAALRNELSDKIRTLELSDAVVAGKASQQQVMVATAIGIVGALLAGVGLLLRVLGY